MPLTPPHKTSLALRLNTKCSNTLAKYTCTRTILGTWVNSAKDRVAESPTSELVALQQEKDQKIARLTDELTRLQAIQKDSERKNNKIGMLESK